MIVLVIAILAGLAIAGTSVWAISRDLKSGSISSRSGKVFTRGDSPGIFWGKVAFQILFCFGGIVITLMGIMGLSWKLTH